MRGAGREIRECQPEVCSRKLAMHVLVGGLGDVEEQIGIRPLTAQGLVPLFAKGLADTFQQCLKAGHGHASGSGRGETTAAVGSNERAR